MTFGLSKIRETSMKRISFLVVRIGVTVLCVVLLLVPGLTMAYVWTPIDLVIALAGIIVSLFVAAWLPTWKWMAAIVTSLLIAVPPYPYWLFNDNKGNWYFHFFRGFNLHNLPLPTFGLVFTIAMVLFCLLYWATAGLKKSSPVA
jgi:hypothetical protein